MPQTALSNGELLRKTLKTVGVMVGSTAVWLGSISLAAMLATGSSASATSASPLEKAGAVTAPTSAALGASPHGVAPGVAGGGVKAIRRPAFGGSVAPKDPPKPGDPI
jgi:hypothetical protein